MSLLDCLITDPTVRTELMDVLKEMGASKVRDSSSLSTIGLKHEAKKVK